MEEEDKEALQKLADAQERSLSQMAVLLLKKAIKEAEEKQAEENGESEDLPNAK
jgi:hypothetical protein